MMRFVLVVIDCSENMNDNDFKPDRYTYAVKCIDDFIHNFLDLNPVGQIGIALTYDRLAHMLCPLSGLSGTLISKIRNFDRKPNFQFPSIQNSLQLALKSLSKLPSHIVKEVIYINGSNTSSDPGNIYKTIEVILFFYS